MDDDHFREALRQAELNPVGAGFPEHAQDWAWSSAPVGETGLSSRDRWSRRSNGPQWNKPTSSANLPNGAADWTTDQRNEAAESRCGKNRGRSPG